MSNTANWSYTQTAQVKPWISYDTKSQDSVYGDPYEIKCTWSARAEQRTSLGGQSSAGGDEFVSKHFIYTEDKRPKALDLILINDPKAQWEEIKAIDFYDMSFFGEEPDFTLVT